MSVWSKLKEQACSSESRRGEGRGEEEKRRGEEDRRGFILGWQSASFLLMSPWRPEQREREMEKGDIAWSSPIADWSKVLWSGVVLWRWVV